MKPELAFLLDSAAWPALVVDGANNNICRANLAAARLFGASVQSGTASLSSFWAPDNPLSPEQFLARQEGSPGTSISVRFQSEKGPASFLVNACVHVSDGKKYYLLQLLNPPAPAEGSGGSEGTQALKQKLDFALQLARTVALDFNNALTGVMGHASLVLGQMEPQNPWRKSLIEVEKSAERAAEIADDLGSFSRQEKARMEGAPAAGNAHFPLQRAVELLQRGTMPYPVEWVLDLEPDPFAVRIDPAKLQSAFTKVLENAVEAFRNNGTVSIQTRNLELAQATQDREAKLTPGTYVCVQIADNGCGIEPEFLPKIFAPFFTTKHGTHRGLGLPFAYGIITTHGGRMAVSSQPGSGTSVRIYLPAEAGVLRATPAISADLKGQETVLIVDDEDLLLTLGKTVLTSYGYKVLTANNAKRALEVLDSMQRPVDLVITDLVMPGMNGVELKQALREKHPGVRVLLTSGAVRAANQPVDAGYLPKPFTAPELLAKVRQILERAPKKVD